MSRASDHEENVSRMLKQVSNLHERLAVLAEPQTLYQSVRLSTSNDGNTSRQDNNCARSVGGATSPVTEEGQSKSSCQGKNVLVQVDCDTLLKINAYLSGFMAAFHPSTSLLYWQPRQSQGIHGLFLILQPASHSHLKSVNKARCKMQEKPCFSSSLFSRLLASSNRIAGELKCI